MEIKIINRVIFAESEALGTAVLLTTADGQELLLDFSPSAWAALAAAVSCLSPLPATPENFQQRIDRTLH